MYIVDTDIIIAYLGGDEKLLERFTTEQDRLFTTSINIAELYYGAYKSSRAEGNIARLQIFIENIDILDFTLQSAEQYGRIKAQLLKVGKPIGENDLFIASIALSLGYRLVTHNTKHFSQVEGLKLEDWLI